MAWLSGRGGAGRGVQGSGPPSGDQDDLRYLRKSEEFFLGGGGILIMIICHILNRISCYDFVVYSVTYARESSFHETTVCNFVCRCTERTPLDCSLYTSHVTNMFNCVHFYRQKNDDEHQHNPHCIVLIVPLLLGRVWKKMLPESKYGAVCLTYLKSDQNNITKGTRLSRNAPKGLQQSPYPQLDLWRERDTRGGTTWIFSHEVAFFS